MQIFTGTLQLCFISFSCTFCCDMTLSFPRFTKTSLVPSACSPGPGVGLWWFLWVPSNLGYSVILCLALTWALLCLCNHSEQECITASDRRQRVLCVPKSVSQLLWSQMRLTKITTFVIQYRSIHLCLVLFISIFPALLSPDCIRKGNIFPCAP